MDPDGTVLYGSDCSIGLLTADDTLVLPPDGDGLANMAVQELVEHTLEVWRSAYLRRGEGGGLKKVLCNVWANGGDSGS